MAKKNSIHKPGAIPVWESSDGLKVFRKEDLDPEYALEMQRLKEDAELNAPNDMPFGLLRYAVSDDALPQGADALVFRDGTGDGDATIVVSRGSATDRILSIARFVLFQDQRGQPQIDGQKSILVWEDGTVAVDNKVTRVNAGFAGNAGEAEALLNEKGKITHLMGVGKVRTVRGR